MRLEVARIGAARKGRSSLRDRKRVQRERISADVERAAFARTRRRKGCERVTARENSPASSAPEQGNYPAARGLGNFGSQNGLRLRGWAGEQQTRGAGLRGSTMVVSVAAPQPLEVGGRTRNGGGMVDEIPQGIPRLRLAACAGDSLGECIARVIFHDARSMEHAFNAPR